ncbi:hypothetical protein JD844_024859 [Phrynosoma platyrhinos]|uniref:tRNA/rRNA methyltransferase SpoU type domain-containing protein n=1 Tax=Phrynosoma platyrhinos TaxID=52577 RepID=A0ABQ7SYF6_PHRPL|nr:hypothetical protein JD844_024859 [Phrynosoma platyrhinos]
MDAVLAEALFLKCPDVGAVLRAVGGEEGAPLSAERAEALRFLLERAAAAAAGGGWPGKGTEAAEAAVGRCLPALLRAEASPEDRQRLARASCGVLRCCVSLGGAPLAARVAREALEAASQGRVRAAVEALSAVAARLEEPGLLRETVEAALRLLWAHEEEEAEAEALLVAGRLLPALGRNAAALGEVWEGLMKVPSPSPSPSEEPRRVSRTLLALSALSDALFPAAKRDGEAAAPGLDARLRSGFWKAVQKGLTARDGLCRKRARFLLKRAIHVIRPVLPKLNSLYEHALSEQKDCWVFHPSWYMCIYKRMFESENKTLVKEGVVHFLEIFRTKCLPTSPGFPEFIIGPLMDTLSESSLYSRLPGQIIGTCPPLGMKLQEFLVTFFTSLPAEEKSTFLLTFIQKMSSRHWCAVPILFFSMALAHIPAHRALDVAGLLSLSIISIYRDVLQCTMITHQILLRGAAQCYLLQAAILLTDIGKVSLSDISNFIVCLRPEESLGRGTILWRKLCDWLCINDMHFRKPVNCSVPRDKTLLSVYVQFLVEDYLKTPTASSLDSVSPKGLESGGKRSSKRKHLETIDEAPSSSKKKARLLSPRHSADEEQCKTSRSKSQSGETRATRMVSRSTPPAAALSVPGPTGPSGLKPSSPMVCLDTESEQGTQPLLTSPCAAPPPAISPSSAHSIRLKPDPTSPPASVRMRQQVPAFPPSNSWLSAFPQLVYNEASNTYMLPRPSSSPAIQQPHPSSVPLSRLPPGQQPSSPRRLSPSPSPSLSGHYLSCDSRRHSSSRHQSSVPRRLSSHRSSKGRSSSAVSSPARSQRSTRSQRRSGELKNPCHPSSPDSTPSYRSLSPGSSSDSGSDLNWFPSHSKPPLNTKSSSPSDDVRAFTDQILWLARALEFPVAEPDDNEPSDQLERRARSRLIKRPAIPYMPSLVKILDRSWEMPTSAAHISKRMDNLYRIADPKPVWMDLKKMSDDCLMPDWSDAKLVATMIFLAADVEDMKHRTEWIELKPLLNPLLDILLKLGTNPYISSQKSDKSLQLLLKLLQTCSRKRSSSQVDGITTYLQRSLMSATESILHFLLRRLTAHELNTISDLQRCDLYLGVLLEITSFFSMNGWKNGPSAGSFVSSLINASLCNLQETSSEEVISLEETASHQGWGKIVARFIHDQWVCLNFVLNNQNVSKDQNLEQFLMDEQKCTRTLHSALEAITVLPSDHVLPVFRCMKILVPKIMFQIIEMSSTRTGVFNVLLSYCCHTWILSTPVDKRAAENAFSNASNYSELLIEACLFGTVFRRDQRVIQEVCAFVENLGDECAANVVTESTHRDDHYVRICAIKFLCLLDESNTLHKEFIEDFVLKLLDKGEFMLKSKIHYYVNSLQHRIKNRLWQTLLVLFPKLHEGEDQLKTSICTFLAVLSHFDIILQNTSEKATLKKALVVVLQWCFHHNFSVRLYALIALKKIWGMCKASFVNDFEALAPTLTGNVSLSHINTITIRRNAKKNWQRIQKHFFFEHFHPLKDYCLEVRLNSSESCNEREWTDVQKKIIPWKDSIPDLDLELVFQDRTTKLGKSNSKLIVVASLLDKPTNLGGLCRTCEIFGVSALIVGSLHYTNDKQFQYLSVSAEQWLSLIEVKPFQLVDYLEQKKIEGYTIIGVEQTAKSCDLTEYSFPEKSLLLLGNEHEGIPADLIQQLDTCVEIPQQGVIRSLNVHVSGALLIWEYTRQQIIKEKKSR